MTSQRTSHIVIFVMGFLLATCGPTQADLDARSTQIAAEVYATQTAHAPTPTKTSTTTPTSTPPSDLDYAAAVLTLADLPSSYQEMPAESLEEFERSVSGEPYPANSVFAYWILEPYEILMGFTTILTTDKEQAELDRDLPFFTEGYIRGIAQGFGGSYFQTIEIMGDYDEFGDKSTSLSTVVKRNDIPYRFDVIGFRRESIAAWILLMYTDGETPTISIAELTQTLDDRILMVLHPERAYSEQRYSFPLDSAVFAVPWDEDEAQQQGTTPRPMGSRPVSLVYFFPRNTCSRARSFGFRDSPCYNSIGVRLS